jgi:hypothetical protein
MDKQEAMTVVFTTDCVEKCGVLPDLRHTQEGNIEVFIPGTRGIDAAEGEWVSAQCSEFDGIVTLSCDATSDGFKAIYKATVQRYEEAWHTEKRHRSRICSVPRQCGPCDDSLDALEFSFRTLDGVLFLDTQSRSYQFSVDPLFRFDDIRPALVSLVVGYLEANPISDDHRPTFFDVLKQVLSNFSETGQMYHVSGRAEKSAQE